MINYKTLKMKTNFFQQIEKLNINSEMHFVIKKSTNGFSVGILIKRKGLEDQASKLVPPMTLKGTAQELDERFFETISKPAKETDDFFSNLASYEIQLKDAAKKTKMQETNQSKENREKETRKKKYDEQMKKVIELENKEKVGEAIAAMPKAEQFPEQAEEIKTKLDELNGKLKAARLFD